jgi:hypothetical protein
MQLYLLCAHEPFQAKEDSSISIARRPTRLSAPDVVCSPRGLGSSGAEAQEGAKAHGPAPSSLPLHSLSMSTPPRVEHQGALHSGSKLAAGVWSVCAKAGLVVEGSTPARPRTLGEGEGRGDATCASIGDGEGGADMLAHFLP